MHNGGVVCTTTHSTESTACLQNVELHKLLQYLCHNCHLFTVIRSIVTSFLLQYDCDLSHNHLIFNASSYKIKRKCATVRLLSRCRCMEYLLYVNHCPASTRRNNDATSFWRNNDPLGGTTAKVPYQPQKLTATHSKVGCRYLPTPNLGVSCSDLAWVIGYQIISPSNQVITAMWRVPFSPGWHEALCFDAHGWSLTCNRIHDRQSNTTTDGVVKLLNEFLMRHATKRPLLGLSFWHPLIFRSHCNIGIRY